jgi:hypothetical protein
MGTKDYSLVLWSYRMARKEVEMLGRENWDEGLRAPKEPEGLAQSYIDVDQPQPG